MVSKIHLLSSRRTASCASRSTKASMSSLLRTLAAGPAPAALTASSCCCCRFLRSASVTRRNFCVLMALRLKTAAVGHEVPEVMPEMWGRVRVRVTVRGWVRANVRVWFAGEQSVRRFWLSQHHLELRVSNPCVNNSLDESTRARSPEDRDAALPAPDGAHAGDVLGVTGRQEGHRVAQQLARRRRRAAVGGRVRHDVRRLQLVQIILDPVSIRDPG